MTKLAFCLAMAWVSAAQATWTGPFLTDIDGTGMGGSKESSIDDCKKRCQNEPTCKAAKFSATDFHDDGNNCFIYDNQNDNHAEYLSFKIWKYSRPPTTTLPPHYSAWTGPFNTDIDGTGMSASKESSADDCKKQCEREATCKAMKYSSTETHDDGNNCFIYDNRNDNHPANISFHVWKYYRWTGPFNTDIDGTGMGGSKESSIEGCKVRCRLHPTCKAIKYSATEFHNDGHNCFIFDKQNDNRAKYMSFQVWKYSRVGRPNDLQGCIMNNMNAINDMVDSSLFIFAMTRDCSKNGTASAGSSCVSDLFSVVNSALGVAEFMLKVFKTCGEISTSNHDCEVAGISLGASIAAVTSNVAAAAGDCKAPGDSMKRTGNYYKTHWTYAGLDTCTVKVGAAMSGLQAAIISMMIVKGKCNTGNAGKCISAALDIISAVGNLAVFIENVVANCNHDTVEVTNACATDIGGILSGLAATASTAITIKSKCTPQAARLYADLDAPAVPTRNDPNLFTGMLVIFLPITGLASYYGGSKFTGHQGRMTYRTLVATDEFE